MNILLKLLQNSSETKIVKKKPFFHKKSRKLAGLKYFRSLFSSNNLLKLLFYLPKQSPLKTQKRVFYQKIIL